MADNSDDPTTKPMNFPSSPGCLSKPRHDSNCSNSPRSLVDAFSREVSLFSASSSPDIVCAEETSIDTMKSKRNSCSAISPTGRTQRIFPARISMARKQARQYSNDNDNMFSIVEEEKPRITKLDRVQRSQFHSKNTATTPDQNPLPWSRHSISGPPVSNKISLEELRQSRFDAAASVFRSGQQPKMRQARFGSQRTHLLSQNLVSERKKLFDPQEATVKAPKRKDSTPPPAPMEKTEPGTPSTECSIDEWSCASWIETPTVVDSKKSLFP